MITFYLTKNNTYIHICVCVYIYTCTHRSNIFTYLMSLKYRLMNSNEEWGGKKTDLAFWVVKRKSRAWNVDTGLNKVTHGMHLHSAGTQAEPRKC